jgi:hypothetical protein
MPRIFCLLLIADCLFCPLLIANCLLYFFVAFSSTAALVEVFTPYTLKPLLHRHCSSFSLPPGYPLFTPGAVLARITGGGPYLLLTSCLPLRFVSCSFQMLYKTGLYLLLTPYLPPHALKRRFPYLAVTPCLPTPAFLFTLGCPPVYPCGYFLVTSGLPLALVVVGLWCPYAYPLFT